MKKLILIFTAIVLLGSLHGCSSPEEKAAQYVASGDQLYAENNIEKAAIEYKNALQVNQNLPDAWYGLARIHERKQEWRQAYSVLAKIRDTNPNHVNGRIMLAQLLLASNQIDQALEDAKFIIELAPDEARGHSLMAAVQFRLGNFDLARESVQRAISLDPNGKEAILVKARILIAEKKYDEAIAVIDQALQAQPDNVSLYLMKIQAYAELGDQTAIENVYKALVQRFPENVSFKLALIRQYIQIGDIDQAELLLTQIAEDSPDEIDAKLNLVRFTNQHRSADEAIALIRGYIEKDESEYRFKFALGELYLSNTRTDEAIDLYRNIIADDKLQPNGINARNKLALIYLRAGKQDEARKLVDEVLANDKSNEDALLYRAGFGIAERNYDDAIVDLRTVLRDNPDSVKALGLIGQAYLASGSTQLAIESYSKAFEISPQAAAVANGYANILLRNNDPKQAGEVLQRSIEAGNRSVGALKLLTQVKLTLGEWDQAEKLAQQLKVVEGQEALSEQVLGLVYQGRDQQDDSVDAFKRAHKLAPDSSQPVVALVRSYVQNNQIDEAMGFLQSLIAENENNSTAYLLLGQLNLQLKDTEAAIGNFKRVVEINPRLAVGYRSLAGIYARSNKLKDAEGILMEGLRELPDNTMLTFNLAAIYQSQQAFDKAIELYEALLQADPNLIVAKNNLASMLTDYRQDQASYDRAREMAAEFRDSSVPQFQDTYAWAAVKSGINLEEAVAILGEIVRNNETVGVYHYHLGEGYRKKGDAESARTHLEKAIALEQPGSAIAAEASKALKSMPEFDL